MQGRHRTNAMKWYVSAHFVKGVEGNLLAHALQNAKYSVLYFMPIIDKK